RAVQAQVVPVRPAGGLLAREDDCGGVGEAPVGVHDRARVVLELVECAPVRAIELAYVAVLRAVTIARLAVALWMERMLPAVVLPDQLGEDERPVRGCPSVVDLVERSQFCLGHGGPLLPCRRQTVRCRHRGYASRPRLT